MSERENKINNELHDWRTLPRMREDDRQIERGRKRERDRQREKEKYRQIERERKKKKVYVRQRDCEIKIQN